MLMKMPNALHPFFSIFQLVVLVACWSIDILHCDKH